MLDPIGEVVSETGPFDPVHHLHFPCESVVQHQNDYLSRAAAKKSNHLSCRCSGCDSDGKYPVVGSPSDSTLLNTAYNGSGGFLTSGLDLQWEVGSGTDTGPSSVSVSSWTPAHVVTSPSPLWLTSPFNNANWISNSTDGSNQAQDVYFRCRFNLSSSIDPATFALTMDFYADNRVWDIYVNGTSQKTQLNGISILPQFPNETDLTIHTAGFVQGNGVRIRLDNHWRDCENELIVHVKSPGGEMGFLAQNVIEAGMEGTDCDCHCECTAIDLPNIRPCITVGWGDTPCDCLETDDVEVLYVTACNCYSNVAFRDLSIGKITVTEMNGNAVPNLPDGTPSVRVIPSGPLCFGDIGPCTEGQPSCVSREVVLYTRGAVGRNYRLAFDAICFGVYHQFQLEQCFTMKICQD